MYTTQQRLGMEFAMDSSTILKYVGGMEATVWSLMKNIPNVMYFIHRKLEITGVMEIATTKLSVTGMEAIVWFNKVTFL